MISVVGDEVDGNGKFLEEELELWRRDPVACVEDLIQNPVFKNLMKYAPEHVYRDKEGRVRIFEEMWTGDWWWEVQVSVFYGFKVIVRDLHKIGASHSRSNHCTDYYLIG